MNLHDVFGDNTDRQWAVLRSIVIGHLRKKFRTATYEQLEDAASGAVLDLCDYWAGLESSMSPDTARNWNYAKWRATRKASALLYGELTDEAAIERLDRPVTQDGDDKLTFKDQIADAAPAVLTDEEYQAKVTAFIDAIPDGEMEMWLSAVVNGESVRGESKRTGQGYGAVHRKRVSGKKRLTVLAVQHGVRIAV